MFSMRAVRPEELDAVWALIQRAAAHMREQGNPQWDETYPHITHFANGIAAGDLFAACADSGTILGVLQINTWYEPCYDELTGWKEVPPALALHKMAVDPAAQRRGVGSALFEYAVSMAREQGLCSVRVDTYTLNAPMRALITKFDFHPVGEVFFPDRPLPYIVYEKLISDQTMR